jgi:CTD small phosphatase-like protein 2
MLPATDKKTLLFDLDETLVHCNSNSFIPGDVLLNISHEGEKMEVKKFNYSKASLNIRPYTSHLLQTLSRNFELIVFTAS